MSPEERRQDEIDFRKIWAILKRRWRPATGVLAAVLGLAGLAALLEKPVYEAQGKLVVKPDRSSALTGLEQGSSDIESLALQNNPADTQVEVVASSVIAKDAIALLKLKDDRGKPLLYKNFVSKLTVEALPATDVLTVAYQSENPEEAARVVNTIMKLYLQTGVKANQAEAANAREFIQKQLPRSEAAVVAAETALRDFREKNNLINLNEEGRAAANVVTDLDTQIAQARAQLAEANAQLAELRLQLGLSSEEALTVAALNQSTAVQQAFTQLQQSKQNLAREQARFRSNTPVIDNLETEIASLNSFLQEQVAAVVGSQRGVSVDDLQIGTLKTELIGDYVRFNLQRQALGNRIAELSQTQSAYRQRMSVLPNLEKTQRQLERQLQAAQGTYETLLNNLQKTEAVENQTIGNARIISPAVIPDDPASPPGLLLLAGAGVVGTLLAVGTAFTLDLLDGTIKTVKEAREFFPFPLLGVIPDFRYSSGLGHELKRRNPTYRGLFNRDHPSFSVDEAYLSLQASLTFLSSDKRIKAIAVTSASPGEGKSEVAANLAAAMAKVGKRVLLVDADLRNPVQHEVWGLPNVTGLNEVIVGRVPLVEAVQEVRFNFYILTSGKAPPNSLILLDSHRMDELVVQFLENYDFVILDSPPLVGAADTGILGRKIGKRKVDGLLLVARPGVLETSTASAAQEYLTQTGLNTIGLVVNGVDISNDPDSFFQYPSMPRAADDGKEPAPASRPLSMSVPEWDTAIAPDRSHSNSKNRRSNASRN